MTRGFTGRRRWTRAAMGFVRVAVAGFILLVSATPAPAQELSLSASLAQSDHELVGNPAGLAAGATFPLRGVVGLRLAFDLLDHRQTRTGSTCVGLILPGDYCPQESIDETTSLRGVAIALIAPAARRRGASLAVVPAVGIVTARTMGRGEQTGRALAASAWRFAVGVGSEVSVSPNPAWPMSLRVGTHVAWIGGPDVEIVDGYTPFGDVFRLTRLDIGVAVWRRRPAVRIAAGP